MNRSAPHLIVAGAALLFAGAASSTNVEVALPAEYGVPPSDVTREAVYLRSAGEAANPFDRATVEAQCDLGRSMGMTDKHPVFEPGFDQPLKTENHEFLRASQRASYRTLHAYRCHRPPEPGETSMDYQCGCRFGIQPLRTAHIHTVAAGRYEILMIDLTAGTARRETGRADKLPVDPDHEAALVQGHAPVVVGKDVIAGIPCVLRRRQLSAAAWSDVCIVEDEAGGLPPDLRLRALAETTPSKTGQGKYTWTRVLEVVPKALVDAAVFKLPDGVAVKEVKR